MSNIIKRDDKPTGLILNKGKLSSTKSSFQQRVKQGQAEQTDPLAMSNRICLMLDCSGSMQDQEHSTVAGQFQGRTRRIDLLKDAVENFIQRCNLSETCLAIETFPAGLTLPLTSNYAVLQSATYGLSASGGTPMRQCVELAIGKVKMTRGVIVSDGAATDWYVHGLEDDENVSGGDKVLDKYIEAKIPIDCVHISLSTSGEELLRRIAKLTGGIFIKFTDVSAFATAFGYLAPGYRAMLTDGRVSANDIGAKEVR